MAGRVDREAEDELGDISALTGELTTHETGEGPRDRQTETKGVAHTRVVSLLLVALEDALPGINRDAISIVANDHRHQSIYRIIDANPDVRTAVANGIREQIAEDLSHPLWVGDCELGSPEMAIDFASSFRIDSITWAV